MPSAKQRVQVEAAELSEKLHAAADFYGRKVLKGDAQQLLGDQIVAMNHYLGILHQRLEIWED